MQPQPTPLLRTTTHLRRVRARGTANFGNFQPGNPRAGTLDYVKKAAPLILWGPYLWTAGDTPRSDGLAWLRSDFETDAVHLSKAGETKAAEKLLDFFKTSTYTRCWFVNGGTCY